MTTEAELSRRNYGFPEKPSVVQLKTWTLQEKFLAAFAETGAINLSASSAKCSVESYYHWVGTDAYMFQKRFELAKDRVLETMILEIDRRAFKGYDHPVIHQGVITDTYKAFDSNLAMFRVKKLDPSYRDNYAVMEDVSAIRESLDALRQLGVPRLDQPKVIEGTATVVEE